MALEDIDKIITTIKKSKDKDDAKKNLMKRFKFTERQTIAILEMKLQQLASLERLKVEEELKEKKKLIKEFSAILKDPKKILTIIKDELKNIRDKYGDERRTRIVKSAVNKLFTEDLIPNEPTIVMITHDGYIKRLPPTSFNTQKRGGKGVIGLTTKEEDLVEHLFSTMTHTDLLFFTSRGRVFELKAYEIPQTTRTAKGQALVNFLQLAPEETVTTVLPISDLGDYKFLMMVTKNGSIKKVSLEMFKNIRRSGLIAIKLKEDDILSWVKPTGGKDDVILVSKNGQAIRSKEKNIRAMGRAAAGVRGIRLKKGDTVVGMDIINEGKATLDEQLLVVMENGYGKRSSLSFYKVQGRGGTGVKTANITSKTGDIVSAFVVNKKLENEDVIIISEKGQVIRLPLKSVNILGRATQGVHLMRFKEASDRVANVTFI
jgi:DNA gyrase subunit A